MTTLLLPADSPDTVETAAGILRRGGLVGIPTETVYGLGADGLCAPAVMKIFEAKGRPQDNPLILHVSGPGQVDALCHDIPSAAWTLMDRFWPGPLTLILPARPLIPSVTTAGLTTVGIRCPDCAVTRAVIDAAGLPIAAPSANRSGKPSPTTAAHVLHDMDGRIDAVLDAGPCRVGLESTIVDLTADPPRLLRPGGITPSQLRELLPRLVIDPAVTRSISDDTVVRAPGMKYTHYSPQGSVIIVRGSAEGAASYILRHLQAGDRVLCYEEELSRYPAGCAMSYGSSADPASLAHGLFAALRDLDRAEIPVIYARCPEGDGIAFAVSNRLKKAAGFQIVEGDPA